MIKNTVIILLLLIGGCSAEQTEKFVFQKVLEYQLKDDCGDDKECVHAVEEQIEACMEKSDWKRYVENDDDKELERFVNLFFPCFMDPNGNPYFN